MKLLKTVERIKCTFFCSLLYI